MIPHPQTLSIEGLTIQERRTGHTLVSDLSLALRPGEMLGLVGASGSGKTLTALSVLGVLPANVQAVGRIRLAGQDLAELPAQAARRLRAASLGAVFQNPMTSLNPRLTVGTQLREALPPARRADADQAAIDLLDRVQIARAAQRLSLYPHELSGGMAQRVVIAMALARAPQLLVADEPTTALDVTVQARILDLLDDLRRERGFSVLFVTHDLAIVRDRAETVAVMQDGSIVETGPADAVFRRPKSAPARLLVALSSAGLAAADPDGTPATAAPLLTAVGIDKTFAAGRRTAHKALDAVSLAVHPGRSLAIVGESGSGKTTLARIIAGLDRADRGTIRLDGQALIPARRSPDIQYVFQDPYSSLDPRIDVTRTVAEPRLAAGEARPAALAAARALLADVGIDDALQDRRPVHLSGGQRQRVAIARALATHPRLLIADEPVTALDAPVKDRIVTLLGEICARRGTTLVLITHDLSIVPRLCRHVVVMQHGRIVESGPVGAVFAQPRHPVTRQLIDAVPGRRVRPAPPLLQDVQDPQEIHHAS